jgi:hypothetical protein
MLKIYKACVFYIFYRLLLYLSGNALVATARSMEFKINCIEIYSILITSSLDNLNVNMLNFCVSQYEESIQYSAP